MYYRLSSQEQAAMEHVIAQVAQNHGQAEEAVRKDITELIAESMKTSRSDPAARELWKECPCAGDVPTPEDFLLWTSCRVRGELTGWQLDGAALPAALYQNPQIKG